MARDGISDCVNYVNKGYQPGQFKIIGEGERQLDVSTTRAGSIGAEN